MKGEKLYMSGFKKMILPWMVFNDDTLNIFTDGSIRKIQINGYDEETIGCAGAYAVSSDIQKCVDKKCTVIRQIGRASWRERVCQYV